jgi:integrase
MEKTIKLDGHYDPALVDAPVNNDVYLYIDSLVPFLRLKVTKANRSWVYDRSLFGMHIKRQIGKLQLVGLVEARRTAYEWDVQVDKGEMPPTRVERYEKVSNKLSTMREVWHYYLTTQMTDKSSASRIEETVLLHWGPMFGIKVSALEADFIRSFLARIASDAGKPTANKHLVTIKAALNHCKLHGMVKYDSDIFKGIKPYEELERTEYLKSSEMPALLAALDKQSEQIRHAVLLLIYTCQRKSNVLKMEWKEIDMDACVWTIPASKTKTRKPYAVVLTPKSMEILTARAAKNQTGFVFPAIREGNSKNLTNLNTAWRQIKVDAGVPHLRIHDLRHTGATWLAQKGANAYIIQKALNHQSARTSQRYVNLVHDDVRALLEASQ